MERKKSQPKQAPAADLNKTPEPTQKPQEGAILVELHELLGVRKQDLPLICPHCGKEVHQLVWRTFGDPATAAIIGCGNCRRIIGGHLL